MRGPDKGFHDLPERAFEVPAGVCAAELGAAVREALSRCVAASGVAV